MSIYGPPRRPPKGALERPEVRSGLKLALWIVGFATLLGVAVAAYAGVMARSRLTLEIDRAESARRDLERSREATRRETAELLPPIPRPPKIEIPPPLQSAELLPNTALRPANEPPAPLQTAEILH